jgi:asparagine synthase (glutamine-hydrolysing)
MCGITGILNLSSEAIPQISNKLDVMKNLLNHRGPDGEGIWVHQKSFVGLAHKRLSIIDLSTSGHQPMTDESGNWITYNGEIYNFIELRIELGAENFSSTSDTEVILRAYQKWGKDCVNHFRGMFAFAIWDDEKKQLFCARDHFGIKPFYYTVVNNVVYFASEIKALLPFIPSIETNLEGLKEYLTFQFCLAGKTLFKGVNELLPAHTLTISNGAIHIARYWEVFFEPDFSHTENYYEEKLRSLIKDSVKIHLRSDVPVGSYLSGGVDSSAIASIASSINNKDYIGFIGKFAEGKEFDESDYAKEVAVKGGFPLREITINVNDFIKNIRKVIYHLDYPVAGPGSFPQYMVSQLAAKERKVVLGGQGGDETFGGYTRYLVAYFEQCLKAAIDGTSNNGNFIVTYESIIPNLTSLKNYKPLMQEFWQDELFADMDRRYFRLINRASSITDEIDWSLMDNYSAFETFKLIFNQNNVKKESYFDLMTHFDFKTLLPALLQVEDRVSMAHGLESRVPLLDRKIVEFAATMPSNVKFKNGSLKYILRNAVKPFIPKSIYERKDKMGFPTPFSEWIQGEAREFVGDTFSTQKAKGRGYINSQAILNKLGSEPRYSRKIWGFLCLELWHQEFEDKASAFHALKKNIEGV